MLPTYKKCPMPFLRQVFTKRKKLIKAHDVRLINIPRYEEISVRKLWRQVMEYAELAIYFPDFENTDTLVDRTYFFTILGSVAYDFLEKIKNEAIEYRHTIKGKDPQTLIEIDKDFLAEL